MRDALAAAELFFKSLARLPLWLDELQSSVCHPQIGRDTLPLKERADDAEKYMEYNL
jgi:hypothetical protein